jgi:hypothetical protein
VQKLRRLSPDDCCVSSISAFELYAGVHLVRHPEREKRAKRCVGETENGEHELD